MYVCGITPYDATHMGHAATYVAFDLLQPGLARRRPSTCTTSQNVTDVDDPLLERATATGVDWRELAERETELFREDMTALRVLPPDALRRRRRGDPAGSSTLVERLAGRYGAVVRRADGDLYFAVHADPRFGDVSRLDDGEQMLAVFAERGGDPDRPGKKDPLDACSGGPNAPASRPGTAAARPRAAPAGTSSAPRSRSSTSAGPSTSRAAAPTWSSRTTR